MGALLLSCELRTDGSATGIAVGLDAPTASSGDASAQLAGWLAHLLIVADYEGQWALERKIGTYAL
jgi:hypothetical protein